jgi:hypothetical protein
VGFRQHPVDPTDGQMQQRQQQGVARSILLLLLVVSMRVT